jgi:hypothetical protein
VGKVPPATCWRSPGSSSPLTFSFDNVSFFTVFFFVSYSLKDWKFASEGVGASRVFREF